MMELNIFQYSLEIETLSGLKLNIDNDNNENNINNNNNNNDDDDNIINSNNNNNISNNSETILNLKKRIINKFKNNSEVGNNDGQFYLLNSNTGKMLNDDTILNESLINENNKLLIRRKRYSCFIEHMISLHIFNPLIQWSTRVLCVLLSVLLIAGFAQVSFYLPNAKDVPVTLQTLAIFVISSLLGWKMGCSTIILYLLCGLVGAPFFSNQGHGIGFLHGSTSGYLYGFIVAAFIVGYASELGTDRVYFFNLKSTLISMIIANISIYIIGIPVLASKIGWSNSFKFGLVPFLLGDSIKIVIATIIIPSIWKLLTWLSNKNFILKY